MIVEELLKFFITEVDADLLKSIVVKDLKASNVQAANVRNLLHCWVEESFITFVNNKPEDKLIDLTGNASH